MAPSDYFRQDYEDLPPPKLGRWVYCKYCYKSVLPQIGDGLVECSRCEYGLAPLEEVYVAGSYAAWEEETKKKYHED